MTKIRFGSVGVGVMAIAVLGAGAAVPVAGALSQAAAALPMPTPFAILVPGHYSAQAAGCAGCYSPAQLETNYDMNSLYTAGDNGKGETIVLVDSFGSPTITSDLASFDKGFGLAAPPSFKIITPEGTIPPYKNTTARQSWAIETSLDVEWSHAMAPGANILLVETPVNETIGTTGFPQIVKAEEYVLKNKLGDVISQSFGAPEPTFSSASAIKALRGAYTLAKTDNVTVLAATGDAGASGVSNAAGTKYFTKRVVDWPASDPLVTAVGGTELYLNSAGKPTSAPTVWNNSSPDSPAAGGGGLSTVFGIPSFQSSVSSVVGTARGIPDVVLSASNDAPVSVYLSIPGLPAGYYGVGGTSEASPLMAGVVAVADQVAGHDLGYINPALYALGSASAGLPDITKGNNTVTVQGGVKVTGFTAGTGYDLASGLGTVDGAKLVAALASS
jgi:subtilase family serine protease